MKRNVEDVYVHTHHKKRVISEIAWTGLMRSLFCAISGILFFRGEIKVTKLSKKKNRDIFRAVSFWVFLRFFFMSTLYFCSIFFRGFCGKSDFILFL